MRSNVYYIKLYFNSQNILEKDILSFLDSLNKIKNIQFFFVFLDKSGLETVKEMKKIQESKKFKFYGYPIISNEEERKLLKKIYKENERILLIVVRYRNHTKNTIDNVIKANKKFFYKIDKKNIRIQDVDIVTPLNMRSDADILKLSFLLSKYAVNLLNVKRELDLKNFPNMFLGVALIFDLAKIFKKQKIIKEIIKNYHLYLLDYFKLNKTDILSLDKASEKYIKIIKKINKKELNFQKNKSYLDIIGTLHQILIKNNLLARINNKFKDKKLYWMFFHWFNNSLNTHFAQEVILVFILKNFYEKGK